MTNTTAISSGIFGRLEDLRMSNSERLRLNAYIQDGERIAELSCRALASIRSGIALAGHGAGRLARSIKTLFAQPAQH